MRSGAARGLLVPGEAAPGSARQWSARQWTARRLLALVVLLLVAALLAAAWLHRAPAPLAVGGGIGGHPPMEDLLLAGIAAGMNMSAAHSTATARPAERSATHQAEVDDYLDNCEKHGVPVPGPIDADPGWSRAPIDLGVDAPKYFFAPEKTVLRLWTYVGANQGKCTTLLRQEPGGVGTPFIGTICTDAAGVNACFFDNEVYGAEGAVVRMDEAATRSTGFAALAHPLDLMENCSLCHLGDNPYIVHPGTMLAKILNPTLAKTKLQQFQFVPFGGTLKPWVNPEPLPPLGEGRDACMGCHDLPSIRTFGAGPPFCNIIRRATASTMPPASAGREKDLWPDANGCFKDEAREFSVYFPSLRRLRSMCEGRPVPDCPSSGAADIARSLFSNE